ncbi:MAG: xylose isomerase protein [uncultured bacterium]|uniref:sugar phosphate isomerase/epimerase family protein n=1 Tax=Cypionkella sp. TaxID=2811411 RepID=UPI00028559BE|nr:TIM barrel protein [Cypionkella sp.]EKD60120.1 MAG: xylose isomerase protein [uncultured bacterium]KAF0173387.1 MAG: Xylose isomerase protein [Paracoccaceae bacterium]MDO8325854.1 TIM barrel protein [Cypionkella sp.]
MKLSLTAWSFPACTLEECAAISRALGIGALDVGLFYRSALNKSEILSDPAAAAERLKPLGVALPNYYHLFGEGLGGQNLSLPGTISQNIKDMSQVLTFADAANIGSVFILPGIINPGQSREQAAQHSAESLHALLEVASHHRAKLCIEPHVQSWAESPSLVQRLIDQTGIGLALDYSHFACLGYRQEEVDPLAKHAIHVHLRQAKMGHLQAKFAQGTLNFPAMFATLHDAGYRGHLALEAVHQDYMNTLTEDVLTETISLRDCFQNWRG